MDDETVDRVAQRMRRAYNEHLGNTTKAWQHADPNAKKAWQVCAQAAIDELKPPTP